MADKQVTENKRRTIALKSSQATEEISDDDDDDDFDIGKYISLITRCFKKFLRKKMKMPYKNKYHGDKSYGEKGMDDALFGKEADAKMAYLVALKHHEKLWAEKSRIRWLKQGDRNSKLFHLYTKIRRARNIVRMVEKHDGTKMYDRDGISSYMVDYYEGFHSLSPINDHLELLDSILTLVDEVDLLTLDAIPGVVEIKKAMWDLDPDSSPGPDGFPGYFFHHCREVVCDDFVRTIKDFSLSGKMAPTINNNFLALIPKVDGGSTLDKYWHLCMGNFFCKVLSKILATRMPYLLPRLISDEQKAFQRGKIIHTNIGVGSELTNVMFSDTRGGGMGIKIDIQKAFDTISYEFLLHVMRKFGFSEK
ncbi:uncharacterized protein LOC122094740 [Macadamia integrifolia]|uniref:uncharacterized protein LOC122094740 n=1 Tax=Macadamia integrifolia TaxID=60698 RepID=UPI001C52D44E|nr:uncharacterized protein LOC122094740 [Macadamia integrifolia]